VRRVYPSVFRFATAVMAAQGRQRRDLELPLEGLQALRFGLYLDYIRLRCSDADLVLLSDIRDVLFQRDPFDGVRPGLHLYLEPERVIIGSDPFNSRWIRNLYGRRTVAALADKIVSCSGTVLGSARDIKRYLSAMSHEIGRHSRPMGSHDQGVHNYLLYTGQLEPAEIHQNGISDVLTMGLERNIRTDTDGTVLNNDGSIPGIVHQYDRHPELREALHAKWLPCEPTATPLKP